MGIVYNVECRSCGFKGLCREPATEDEQGNLPIISRKSPALGEPLICPKCNSEAIIISLRLLYDQVKKMLKSEYKAFEKKYLCPMCMKEIDEKLFYEVYTWHKEGKEYILYLSHKNCTIQPLFDGMRGTGA